VTLITTDILEENSVSIFKVTRIGEIGTTLAVTSKWHMLCSLLIQKMEVLHSNAMSVLTRATWHNIPKDGIHQMEWNFRIFYTILEGRLQQHKKVNLLNLVWHFDTTKSD
jgi:hypothetical protein